MITGAPGRRRLTTGHKLLAGLLAASLTLLVGGLSYRSSRQAGVAAQWVAHTHEVLARQEGLLAALGDLEAAQRGFLITGSGEFGERFDAARTQAPAELEGLRRLTADNPVQQRTLDGIGALMARRLALADSTVDDARGGDTAAALALVRSGRGRLQTDSIRSGVARMRAEEQSLLGRRVAERAARERDAGIVIVGGSIAAFALIALMIGVIHQDIALQRRTAAERDRLLVREQASNAQLAAIQRITDATLAPMALDDLLEELMQRLRDTLGVDAACTLLVTRDNAHLEMCKCVGVTADLTERPTIPLGEGVEGRIAADARVASVADVSAASMYDPIAREHFASVLGAPLLVRDDPRTRDATGGYLADGHAGMRVIGVVYLATVNPRVFTEDEERLLAMVAERAASAIERARLYQAERRSEARFRLLIESVRDYALVLLDEKGHVASWNTGAARLFGYTSEAIVGAPVTQLYPPEPDVGAATAGALLAQARAEGIATAEGWRVRADGTRFWADVTYTVVLDEDDGSLVGFTKVTRDLTERRRIEEALVAAKEEAEAASAAKSQFLATMSHEIRTPINAVLGYTQLLELGVTGPVTAGQRDQLHRVEASARHLLGLVNELLDLAKIEADQLRVEHVRSSAREACEEAIALVFPQANARGLSLSTACVGDADVSFMGDPHRVEQIIVNLLSNAVKFTPHGGRVDVTCGLTSQYGGGRALGTATGMWCYVRVADTGIGIPADQLDTIFDPFTQATSPARRTTSGDAGDGAQRPSYSREHGGTGLGLTISRRLARLMGGDVTVESVVGVGTSFTLWLPAAIEPAADAEIASAAGRPPTERRTGSREATGLAAVGRVLRELSGPIIVEHVRHLRHDFAAPNVDRLRDIELEDHLDTLLTELALALAVVEEAAGQASRQLRDGNAIQRVLAQRHGAHRASIGWAEQDVHREFALLRGIIERIVRAQRGTHPELAASVDLESAFEVLARRLDHAERAAADGWRRRMNPGTSQA